LQSQQHLKTPVSCRWTQAGRIQQLHPRTTHLHMWQLFESDFAGLYPAVDMFTHMTTMTCILSIKKAFQEQKFNFR